MPPVLLDLDEFDVDASVSMTWSIDPSGSMLHKGTGIRLSPTTSVSFAGQTYTMTAADLEFDEGQALGAGACGMVRRATVRKIGMTVAVKSIRTDDRCQREQLLNELRGLIEAQGCRHLIQWYAGFPTKAQCVQVVLEFMDLGSLADLSRRLLKAGVSACVPPLPLSIICAQVVDGLDFLHSRGTMHRDIKPSNVLLNRLGEVKITDFGISTELKERLDSCTVAGTVTYMSPERCMGEDYGLSADVWSLGCVAYELAAGHYPFSEISTFPDLFEALVEKPEPRLDAERFLPEACEFVAACLVREVQGRAGTGTLRRSSLVREGGQAGAHETLAGWLQTLRCDGAHSAGATWKSALESFDQALAEMEALSDATESELCAGLLAELQTSVHTACLLEHWAEKPRAARQMLPLLQKLLLAVGPLEVRVSTVQALAAACGDHEELASQAAAAIEKALCDESGEARKSAAKALGRIVCTSKAGHGAAARALAAAANDDAHEGCRAEAVGALRAMADAGLQIGSEVARGCLQATAVSSALVPWLLDVLLNSEDAQLRALAAKCLEMGKLQSAGAGLQRRVLLQLDQALRTDSAQGACLQLLKACGSFRRGGAEVQSVATASLAWALQGHSDEVVRKCALQALTEPVLSALPHRDAAAKSLESLVLGLVGAGVARRGPEPGSEGVAPAGIERALHFNRRCQRAGIAWLRVSYLRGLGSRRLPRRQDLPASAIALGCPPRGATRWVVSHPWLAKQHPDVSGSQLRQLLVALREHGAEDGDVAFYDYGSMYQKNIRGEDDRSTEQLEAFGTSLKLMNELFSSPFCRVIIIASIADCGAQADKPAHQADKPALQACSPDSAGEALDLQGVKLERNFTPYADRGWCFFEFVTTLLFQTCPRLDETCTDSFRKVLGNMFSDQVKFRRGPDRAVAIERCLQVLAQRQSAEGQRMADLELTSILAKNTTRFVKVGYLRRLAGQEGLAGVMPSFRSLPKGAYVTGDPGATRVFAVSCVQATASHADPDGLRVRDLARKLDVLEASDDELVWWNWPCAMPTQDADDLATATGETKRALEDLARALANGEELTLNTEHHAACTPSSEFLDLLYTSPRFRTLVSWTVPEGASPYHHKGWLLYQAVLSAFSGTLIYDEQEVVDIIVEHFFMASLRQKVFTNGKADMDVVADQFKRLLYQRAGLSQLADPCGDQRK